jgi:hypothetical protein
MKIHDKGCPVDPPKPAPAPVIPATPEITAPQALLDAAEIELAVSADSKKSKK